jgi:hypothetical protein
MAWPSHHGSCSIPLGSCGRWGEEVGGGGGGGLEGVRRRERSMRSCTHATVLVVIQMMIQMASLAHVNDNGRTLRPSDICLRE